MSYLRFRTARLLAVAATLSLLAPACRGSDSSLPVLRVGGVAALNPSPPLPIGERPPIGCGPLENLDVIELAEDAPRPARSGDVWLQFAFDSEAQRIRWRLYDATTRADTELESALGPPIATTGATGLPDGTFLIIALGESALEAHWIDANGLEFSASQVIRQGVPLDELPWLDDARLEAGLERLMTVPEPYVIGFAEGAWVLWQEPDWQELATNPDLTVDEVPDRIFGRWIARGEEPGDLVILSEEALEGDWINPVALGNVFRLTAGDYGTDDQPTPSRVAAFSGVESPQLFAFEESVEAIGEMLFAAGGGQVHSLSWRQPSTERVALYEAGDLRLLNRERAVLIEPDYPITRLASVDASEEEGFVSYEIDAFVPILRGAFIDSDENVEAFDIMQESETRTYAAYPVWSASSAFVLVNEDGGLGYLSCTEEE